MRSGLIALPLLAVATVTASAGGISPALAQQSMNHAAVVVDTGDGKVRKLCLAFPEDEISGIEALQRVDTRPSRVEQFGAKGAAVCMLCGVGCATGECFCDPSRYWAYHRSGPGETTYAVSRRGASATVVRDGDVEAWRWGSGEPPPKTSVSEVCGVPEPPPRTTTATTAGGSPPPTATPTTTAPAQSPTETTSTLPPATAPTSIPGAATPGSPTTTAAGVTATDAGRSDPAEAHPEQGAEEAAASPSAAEVKRSLGAKEGSAAEAEATRATTSAGQLVSLAGFTALLAGLLVWRSRLRRAKVRRVRPVR